LYALEIEEVFKAFKKLAKEDANLNPYLTRIKNPTNRPPPVSNFDKQKDH
jgi:hypothetical protein